MFVQFENLTRLLFEKQYVRRLGIFIKRRSLGYWILKCFLLDTQLRLQINELMGGSSKGKDKILFCLLL